MLRPAKRSPASRCRRDDQQTVGLMVYRQMQHEENTGIRSASLKNRSSNPNWKTMKTSPIAAAGIFKEHTASRILASGDDQAGIGSGPAYRQTSFRVPALVFQDRRRKALRPCSGRQQAAAAGDGITPRALLECVSCIAKCAMGSARMPTLHPQG